MAKRRRKKELKLKRQGRPNVAEPTQAIARPAPSRPEAPQRPPIAVEAGTEAVKRDLRRILVFGGGATALLAILAILERNTTLLEGLFRLL